MKESLRETIEKLLALKGACSYDLATDLEISNISMTQLNYLKQVNKLNETTISELSETLHLSKPTVTETIKKLEQYDLVCKRKCNADARKYFIELTDRGEQVANLEKLTIDLLVEQLSEKLSEAEIEKLIDALKSIQ